MGRTLPAPLRPLPRPDALFPASSSYDEPGPGLTFSARTERRFPRSPALPHRLRGRDRGRDLALHLARPPHHPGGRRGPAGRRGRVPVRHDTVPTATTTVAAAGGGHNGRRRARPPPAVARRPTPKSLFAAYAIIAGSDPQLQRHFHPGRHRSPACPPVSPHSISCSLHRRRGPRPWSPWASIITPLGELLERAPSPASAGANSSGTWNAFVLGLGLGVLFTPCAGPDPDRSSPPSAPAPAPTVGFAVVVLINRSSPVGRPCPCWPSPWPARGWRIAWPPSAPTPNWPVRSAGPSWPS